ncbi:MAG: hypothetical protein ACPG5U_08315 [Planktomarina sp.]
MMSEDVRIAFEENRAVLDQVQIGMAEKASPHIDLGIDAGLLRFRRLLRHDRGRGIGDAKMSE